MGAPPPYPRPTPASLRDAPGGARLVMMGAPPPYFQAPQSGFFKPISLPSASRGAPRCLHRRSLLLKAAPDASFAARTHGSQQLETATPTVQFLQIWRGGGAPVTLLCDDA